MQGFLDLPIDRADTDAGALSALADRLGLTAHDAACLRLGGGVRAPLATFDGRLARTAVECFAEPPPRP
jgi:predicted nucleic acid-binding protein